MPRVLRSKHNGVDTDTGTRADKQQNEPHNRGASLRVAGLVGGGGRQHSSRDLVMEQRKGEEEIRRSALQDWCHIFPVSESHR